MKLTPATSLAALAVALAASAVSPAWAQDVLAQSTPPANDGGMDDDPTAGEEIVVLAERLYGQLDTPQPPVLELNAEDIAAYGSGSIADLIDALGPQTGGGSGRGGGFPAILVNGVRISSFREMRSYPPEAIEKVEVFPEDVAQRYGFSADQRVINIVLKRNYSSREIELEYGQPWDGGNSTKEAEATYLQLIGDSRLNLNLSVEGTSLLTEAERGVIQTTVPDLATDPDPALYRSLASDSTSYEATGNFTTRLGDGPTSLSLNATFERDDSLRLQGLDTVVLSDGTDSVLRTFGADDPLTVDSRTSTYALGSTLNSSIGDWQITGTVDANRADSRSVIDRRADTSALVAAAADGSLALDADLDPLVADAGFDVSESTTDTARGLVTAVGRPIWLPAGEVSVTFDAGYDWTGIRSEDTRNPGLETRLKRGNLSTGVNIGVPIASRREGHWAAIGDLNLSASAGIDELSDFGTLTDWSAGLNWGPFETLNFTVNYTVRDAAPSLGQLGNPEISTPNVPVFDLSTGETVLATIVTGGNPFLPAQKQRDWRIGLNWELPEVPFLQQGRVNVEYFNNRSDDVATGFPLLTPTIEAAFPGRVTRDPVSGMITEIDQRPVTFAQQKSQRVRVGINLSGPFGKARPDAGQQNNNPMAAVFRAAGGPQGQGGAPGQAGGPPAGGQFDPSQFQAMRDRFCATPEGETPDVSALPPMMQDRLRGEDGQIDPERLKEMRTRMCSGDGPPQGGLFNPEQFQQIRQSLCGGPADQAPDLTGLPEEFLQRLRGPDGQIDQARLDELRTRICAMPAGPEGQGQGRRSGQGNEGGGFAGGPPPAGPGGPGGPGGGFRGPGGPGGSADGRGRWFVNFNYTYEIENEVLVAPGGPVLDLLDGDATSGGGQPRHSLFFNGGLFYGGFGSFLNVRYSGSSRVDGSGLPGSTDLFFDDYATVNWRVFADLNQRTRLIEQVPLLENTRITFSVDNLFDARQTVTDSAGQVPLRYQPFLIDPVGRKFEIELRKLF